MAFAIDATTYNKPARYQPGHGFSTRSSLPTSAVVHSTNNSTANTSFQGEANFLYTSPDVSADYLIGKDGRIVRFMDSRKYYAWHAGNAVPAFANPKSVGVELHKSTPDPFYPDIQLEALGWLLQNVADEFGITPSFIDTHGQIALPGPYQRKTDPHMWPHQDFIAWRDALFSVDPLKARTLPGIPGAPPVYCSVAAAEYYAARGGLYYCGYPLADQFHDTSLDCDVLRCERVIIKESARYGIEQALLAEAKAEGWL